MLVRSSGSAADVAEDQEDTLIRRGERGEGVKESVPSETLPRYVHTHSQPRTDLPRLTALSPLLENNAKTTGSNRQLVNEEKKESHIILYILLAIQKKCMKVEK